MNDATNTSTEPATYDVWFCDDGLWRIDVAGVSRARAEQVAAENAEYGYRAEIVAHAPDGELPAFARPVCRGR